MKNQSSTIIRVDPDHLDRSIEQPALTRLLNDGWTIGANFVVDDEIKGASRLCLVMVPPVLTGTQLSWVVWAALLWPPVATLAVVIAWWAQVI
jgi:hypothetical protein